MINYSIVMRSVNANLLEINQAKSRINQAKQEGKNPDQKDLDLLLGSKGAETADKFTAQNITQVKVQWEPGKEFKNLLDDAEFNLVASRSAQAAVLKAIKDGKSTVDLNAPIDPDDGDDGNGGGSNGGGSTTGGGSNAGGSGTTGTEGDNKDDTGTSGGNTGEDKGNTDAGSTGGNEHITL